MKVTRDQTYFTTLFEITDTDLLNATSGTALHLALQILDAVSKNGNIEIRDSYRTKIEGVEINDWAWYDDSEVPQKFIQVI